MIKRFPSLNRSDLRLALHPLKTNASPIDLSQLTIEPSQSQTFRMRKVRMSLNHESEENQLMKRSATPHVSSVRMMQAQLTSVDTILFEVILIELDHLPGTQLVTIERRHLRPIELQVTLDQTEREQLLYLSGTEIHRWHHQPGLPHMPSLLLIVDVPHAILTSSIVVESDHATSQPREHLRGDHTNGPKIEHTCLLDRKLPVVQLDQCLTELFSLDETFSRNLCQMNQQRIVSQSRQCSFVEISSSHSCTELVHKPVRIFACSHVFLRPIFLTRATTVADEQALKMRQSVEFAKSDKFASSPSM